MVSFQCEGCGDVLTKKKLDSHRNQCRGASFTCLDCHVHFRGTDYKSHTSCITEAQKHQGSLYKEKPSKSSNRKSVTISDTKALVPRRAYVEDVPDDDAPPHAPSPPPAAPGQPINVFDFLVTDESPNASRVSFGGSKEQMRMVEHAPSVFEAGKQLARLDNHDHGDEQSYDVAFEENGFSYGAGPIRPGYPTNGNNASLEYMTPAPKRGIKDRSKNNDRPSANYSRDDSGTASDKKRKRGHVEELDLSAAGNTTPHELEGDAIMRDAPPSAHNTASATPVINHSGLTGNLNRLLSKSEFPPSPDYSGGDDEKKHHDPTSPLKRSRREKDDGLGISIKGRAGRIMSMLGPVAAVTALTNGNGNNDRALVRTRRHSFSEEGNSHSQSQQLVQQRRPRKHHRVRGHSTSNHVQHSHHRSRRRSSHNEDEGRPARRLKAIEYKNDNNTIAAGSVSDSDAPVNGNGDSQLIVYETSQSQRARAELFMSFVTKGPDSEKGCSVNKVLKRFHRDNPGTASRDKVEEEKELWRCLRLRRNERGEIVVFF